MNDPRVPIAVKVPAMTVGTSAIGATTLRTVRGIEAPASRAASMSASGTAWTPETIMSVAKGRWVQMRPITTAVTV